ncbi:MAG: hypothetical protein WC301_03955 [Candidatus Omnitrophota bacterium]|jgi:hypothetical protein
MFPVIKKNLLVIILFALVTVIFTYPLVFRINTVIPGYGTTDEPFAVISNLWTFKYCVSHQLDLSSCDLQAYPSGMDLSNYAGSSYFWESIKNTVNFLTNEVFTFNFLIILSFILSGWFVYLLVYYIAKSNLAAIISAVIFSFSPCHFSRAWQHLSLSQIQWMPLYLLSLFILKDRPGKKSFFVVLAALFVLTSINFYYSYFMIIVTMVFVAWYFSSKETSLKVKFNFLFLLIFISLAVLILIFPSLLEVYKEKGRFTSNVPLSYNITERPFEDLFAQSARPLSYFLPAVVHPFFGGFTEQFIGSSLYGVSLTEHTLYLGWMPLILAFVAFKRWRRRRKGEVASEGDCPSRFYTGFFVFLAIVAWFFSQPPWWNLFGFKLYMPSFFMYKILPMFRAYCRFGVVLMLAVAVLAGFGLNFILERFRSNKTKIAITALVCGLVLFEFWNWPPYKVIDVSKAPSVYYWLKGQPGDFAISEYPSDADSPNEMYKFYQTKHEKKITNGTIPGTYANKVSQAIRNLSDSATPGTLKWMGVKYVLVHRDDYLKSELLVEIEELNKIPKNRGLKFIRSFPAEECPDKGIMCVQKSGPVDIYEVVAGPVEPEL